MIARCDSDCFAGDVIDRCSLLVIARCDRCDTGCYAGEMIDRCSLLSD